MVSQVADGFISWANEAFNLKIDSSVTALLIVVLFGVGTDYILFLMFRYRERLRAGRGPEDAMISRSPGPARRSPRRPARSSSPSSR